MSWWLRSPAVGGVPVNFKTDAAGKLGGWQNSSVANQLWANGVAFGFQVTLCIGRRFPGGCALRTSHRKGLHDKSLQMVQETPGRKLLMVTG